MRALKYLTFLVAIFAFMVFFGHKDTLAPDESSAITQFETQVAIEQAQPVEVVSKTPGAPSITEPSTVPTTSTPLPLTSTTIPTIVNGEILEDSVNVRSGPGLDFPVVTQLYRWDQVVLGEQVDGWFELFMDGHKYYVSSEFVVLSPVQ